MTGGYLVLDREYEVTPVATDSRFYACLRPSVNDSDGKTDPKLLGKVTVASPQFDHAEWTFAVRDSGPEKLLQLDSLSGKNPYLYCALLFSLSLVYSSPDFKNRLKDGLKIAVLGDNDFYSQADNLARKELPRTAAGLAQLEPFMPLGPLSGVRKTGLGSSAALVTSVVLAVLSYFGVISLDEEHGREVGHATAQLAHCLAQGKVGSGFDVASAVYGSGVYRRFDPEIVGRLISVSQRHRSISFENGQS